MASRDSLVRDLLPSPTSEAPSQPVAMSTPAEQARRRRPVTTDDLQHRTCWICADSEDDDEAAEAAASAGTGAAATAAAGSSSRQGSSATERSRRRASQKRFVHPCKCTLVAHHRCLLTWIQQSRQNRPGEAVKCPQCQEAYIVLENRPWLLNALEWVDRQVGKAVGINVWVLLTTTTLLGATAYGCVAIRLVLGKEAAARTLRAPWPLRYYIQIPLIPFALIASKLHFLKLFDPLTPWLIAFLPSVAHLPFPIIGGGGGLPFFHSGIASQRRLTARGSAFHNAAVYGAGPGGSHAAGAATTRLWPPNPGPTAMMLPFVRVAYLYLRLHISRRVFRRLLDPRRASSQRARDTTPARAEQPVTGANVNGGAAGPTRTQRIVVLGAEGVDAQLLDADPPVGAAAIVDTEREATPEDEELFNDATDEEDGYDIDEFLNEAGTPARANGAGARGGANGGAGRGTIHQQTVYITRQSIGRLILSALTLPFAAAGIGSILASLTRLTAKGSWLRAFLGLHATDGSDDNGGWSSPIRVMQELFSPTSADDRRDEGRTPISRLFQGSASGSSPIQGNATSTGSSTSQTFRAAATYPDDSSYPLIRVRTAMGGASLYDDLIDAPWFRNAIGGLLFIAMQDACRITYRYLKLRQRGRMTVRDLPFEPHLVDNLDLRPGSLPMSR